MTSLFAQTQQHILDIANEKASGNAAYVNVIRQPLCDVVKQHLDAVVTDGPLGQKRITDLTTLSNRPDAAQKERNLTAKWEAAQAKLLQSCNGVVTQIQKDANAEISKLFNDPSKYPEADWSKVFTTGLDELKKIIEPHRKAVKNDTGELLGDIPAANVTEKEELQQRSKEQLEKLDALEKHFKTELERQRDTAIFEAMENTKFGDPKMPPRKPGDPEPAISLSSGLLNNGLELTLAEHAARARVTKRLAAMYKVSDHGYFWNTAEKHEFDKHGIPAGLYSTKKHSPWNQVCEVTADGIKLKAGGWGMSPENYNDVLELFHAKTGKHEGKLSIEEGVELAAVKMFAAAVLARQPSPPTLVLEDKSIKNLLKQKTFLGYQRNSVDDIATACVGLKGLKNDGSPEYTDAFTEARQRVEKLFTELKQEQQKENTSKKTSEQESKQPEAAQQSSASAVARSNNRPKP